MSLSLGPESPLNALGAPPPLPPKPGKDSKTPRAQGINLDGDSLAATNTTTTKPTKQSNYYAISVNSTSPNPIVSSDDSPPIPPLETKPVRGNRMSYTKPYHHIT